MKKINEIASTLTGTELERQSRFFFTLTESITFLRAG